MRLIGKNYFPTDNRNFEGGSYSWRDSDYVFGFSFKEKRNLTNS
jgi:hypothetical protein